MYTYIYTHVSIDIYEYHINMVIYSCIVILQYSGNKMCVCTCETLLSIFVFV